MWGGRLVLDFRSFSMNFRCSSAESLATRSLSNRSFSALFFCAMSCCVGVSSKAARLLENLVTASDLAVLNFLLTYLVNITDPEKKVRRHTSGRNLVLPRVSTRRITCSRSLVVAARPSLVPGSLVTRVMRFFRPCDRASTL